MHMLRVFFDTNVFIFSIEHPRSNSSIAMEMAIDGEIEVVISEEVRLEFSAYLKSEYSKDAAYHADMFLKGLPFLNIVEQGLAREGMDKVKGNIKDKDLAHLAAAEVSKVVYIISFDRDFKRAKTSIPVLTPKEFVKKRGIKPFKTEY